jgi:hypothetical protein
MALPLAIPAAIAAAAFVTQSPVETECILSWANAALAREWISLDHKTGRIAVEGEHDRRLIMSSGGGAAMFRFGMAPTPEIERWMQERGIKSGEPLPSTEQPCTNEKQPEPENSSLSQNIG